MELVSPTTVLLPLAWKLAIAEIAILALFLAAGKFGGRKFHLPAIVLAAVAACATSLGALLFAPESPLRDCQARQTAMNVLPWAIGALMIILLWKKNSREAAIQIGILSTATAGLAMAFCCEEMIWMFAGVEIAASAVCLLLYLNQHDENATRTFEVYVPPSLLASAILLTGMALLIGSSGSTQLASLSTVPAEFAPLVKIGLAFAIAALGFRIAVVPFHLPTLRITDTASFADGSLLSVIAKVAGLIILSRLLTGIADTTSNVWPIIGALAALTMTFGSVAALLQDKLRRVLGFSSIAQSGFMLMALAACRTAAAGCPPLMLCLAVYSLAMIGLVSTLTHLRRNDRPLETIDELAGLAKSRPAAAAVVTVMLLSLCGMAPLPGFWVKLLVLEGLWHADSLWVQTLAISCVLNLGLIAACNLRIVAVMYFRTPLATPKREDRAAWISAVACAVALAAVAALPGLLIRL